MKMETNKTMTQTDLQPPAVWMVRKHPDMRIVDPNGWRPPDHRSFEDHITEEEFDHRYARSTVGPVQMRSARAYYSEQHRCWFVPVASELFNSPDLTVAEPVRVEIKDGQMWITRLGYRPQGIDQSDAR